MTNEEMAKQQKFEEDLHKEAVAHATRVALDPDKVSPVVVEAYKIAYRSGYRSASAAALKALKR